MSTLPIRDLAQVHSNEVVTIMGSGPSILKLMAGDIIGPVITLNDGPLSIARALGLRIYTMQKDGCVPHDMRPFVWAPPGHVCVPPMVAPRPPETLLIHALESPWCFMQYPDRFVFDVPADFNLPWWTMSAPVAVEIASLMGASRIEMVGHDAYVQKDARRVTDGDPIGTADMQAYVIAGKAGVARARAHGLEITFR